MPSFNRVILMGNLTRDPEVRYTNSGVPVATLRLAVSETFRRKETNEKVEKTCFVDVQVWQRQAETCQQYLSKGRPVLVEGRLELDEWETPQGEKRSRLRVRADRVQFLGTSRQNQSDEYGDVATGAAPVSSGAPAGTPPAAPPPPAAGGAGVTAGVTMGPPPVSAPGVVPGGNDIPDDENLPF